MLDATVAAVPGLGGRTEANGSAGRSVSDGAEGFGGSGCTGELEGSGFITVGAGGLGSDCCACAGALAVIAGSASPSRLTANTALHTLHLARTPVAGTFAGSTRYIVAQLGQLTFISSPQAFSREFGPGRSSPFDPCRRSTTKTEPGSVFA
jgi:hypothetical protein